MKVKGLLAGLMFLLSASVKAGKMQEKGIKEGGNDSRLKVMTQNLYVGSDLLTLLQVENPLDIPQAVGRIYKMIASTDFTARAERLARIVAEKRPDIISLQEVSLIKRQTPGDFLAGNPVAAQDVEWDYLAILMEALSAAGLNYQVASVNHAADIEVPMLLSYSPTETWLDDIRLEDRDVILVKEGLPATDLGGITFESQMTAMVAGMEISFRRGAHKIQVAKNKKKIRLLNTHLEVGISGPFRIVQNNQAEELLNYIFQTEETVPEILTGDFNAAPDNPERNPWMILREAGFEDSWLAEGAPTQGPGYTCCQAPDLRNQESMLNERIDHIFWKGAVSVNDARIIGDQPEQRTSEGLWISDHAAVLATFLIP